MSEELNDLDEFLQEEEDEDEWDRALRPLGNDGRDSGGDGLEDVSFRPLPDVHPNIPPRHGTHAPDPLKELKKFTRGPGRKVAAVGMVLLAIAGIVVAQTLLFNQTLTPPSSTLVLIKGCDPVSPTPTSVITGTAGFVTWSCGSTSAIFVQTNGGTVIPTITKGAEWTTTYIYRGTVTATSCAGIPGARATTSGTAITFTAADAGGWSYCSDYAIAINPMSPITYSWSQ